MSSYLNLLASPRAIITACMALLLSGTFTTGHAALSLNVTRVIYDSDQRSASVIVRNPSKQTYAVQSWVNTEADDNTTAVPLLTSPQLFRLEPGSEQLLQINGLPNDLPADRESLFFLNIQEIPQTQEKQGNALNIALRTRIKLFYRPHRLKDNLSGHLNNLQFSLNSGADGLQLQVNNPTPYHITFIRLNVEGTGQNLVLKNAEMLKPFSEQRYPLPGIRPAADLKARFSTINDFGGYTTPIVHPLRQAP